MLKIEFLWHMLIIYFQCFYHQFFYVFVVALKIRAFNFTNYFFIMLKITLKRHHVIFMNTSELYQSQQKILLLIFSLLVPKAFLPDFNMQSNGFLCNEKDSVEQRNKWENIRNLSRLEYHFHYNILTKQKLRNIKNKSKTNKTGLLAEIL